jgi:hypothetical protein
MDGLYGILYCSKCSLPQMPSSTRAQDGAGTSRGREATPNPPPVPPTLAEAIAALVNTTAQYPLPTGDGRSTTTTTRRAGISARPP